jgi:hypothetical protein
LSTILTIPAVLALPISTPNTKQKPITKGTTTLPSKKRSIPKSSQIDTRPTKQPCLTFDDYAFSACLLETIPVPRESSATRTVTKKQTRSVSFKTFSAAQVNRPESKSIRHPLNEQTADGMTNEILCKYTEPKIPLSAKNEIRQPQVPTHIYLPLAISSQITKRGKSVSCHMPIDKESSHGHAFYSRAADFSCIQPMHQGVESPFHGRDLSSVTSSIGMRSAMAPSQIPEERPKFTQPMAKNTSIPSSSSFQRNNDSESHEPSLPCTPHYHEDSASESSDISRPSTITSFSKHNLDRNDKLFVSSQGGTNTFENNHTRPLKRQCLRIINKSPCQLPLPPPVKGPMPVMPSTSNPFLATSCDPKPHDVEIPAMTTLIDPVAGFAARVAQEASVMFSAIRVQERCHPWSRSQNNLTRLWPPSQEVLLQGIHNALAWKPKARSSPVFQFKYSEEAANHNFKVLKDNNFDLTKIMLENPHSSLRPGSEFRPIALLEPIFQNHPLWTRMRHTLVHGAHYYLSPLDEEIRRQDLEAAIEFGNHKSAIKHKHETVAALKKEVEKGWQLPLPMDKLLDIPQIEMAPIGMAEQMKLCSTGERVPSLRLTHNMSMIQKASGTSLNARVETSKLSKCVYGFALSRFINAIVELRRRHPTGIIYLSKFDLKSAYRRVHLQGNAAFQSCISTKGLQGEDESILALLCLRMTFGGKPNPAIFCETSECIVDLAIALSQCRSWSPEWLPSSYSHVLTDPIKLPDDIPFAQARPALVVPNVPESGTVDGFIDDIFSANVINDNNDRADRLAQAVLLAIEILGRPNSDREPLLRDLLLSLEKAAAEGTPNELLIVLGWLLNTRLLLISLPFDKYIAWCQDIDDILSPPTTKKGRVDKDQMESLEGRLQNACIVIPLGNHFMNRIRAAKCRAVKYGSIHLTLLERSQISFWKILLKRAFEGVSMNTVVTQVPDCIYRNDACEYGLGGFSLKTGRAWRYEIPACFIGRRSINFLEFLAAVVSIMLGIFEGEIQRNDNILSATDNTCTQGWIAKSNFDEAGDQAAHAALAQWMASAGLNNDISFSSIWFMGLLNWVADPLSREQAQSDEFLTSRLIAKYPEQVPSTFKISPLPEEISSAIYYLLQTETPVMQSLPTLIVQPIVPGVDGLNSSSSAASRTTPSSTVSPPATVYDSSCLSLKPYENVHGANPLKDMIAWLRVHARPPSSMWQRPSPPPGDPIQERIISESLSTFYRDSSKDTKTTIPEQHSKKQYRGH